MFAYLLAKDSNKWFPVFSSRTSEKQLLLIKIVLEMWLTEISESVSAQFKFYIETSHLICITNQMTGFCMEDNTGLKWVKHP